MVFPYKVKKKASNVDHLLKSLKVSAFYYQP